MVGACSFLAWLALGIPTCIGAQLDGEDFETEVLRMDAPLDTVLTYRDAGRWFLGGLWGIIRFLFWYLWKGLFIGGRMLLRIIHSYERMMCGTYGTLGGFAAWLVYRRFAPAHNLGVELLYVASGAILGAAAVSIGWRLFESREPAKTT
jgi:hypothetical protein